jgi:hypothetical protein
MQAASEDPDTSSHHLDVERVDIAHHRFVLCDGRVVAIGVVNSNQILRHDFSCNDFRAGRLPCLHDTVERPDRNSTNRRRDFPAAAADRAPAAVSMAGVTGWSLDAGRKTAPASASKPARNKITEKGSGPEKQVHRLFGYLTPFYDPVFCFSVPDPVFKCVTPFCSKQNRDEN